MFSTILTAGRVPLEVAILTVAEAGHTLGVTVGTGTADLTVRGQARGAQPPTTGCQHGTIQPVNGAIYRKARVIKGGKLDNS